MKTDISKVERLPAGKHSRAYILRVLLITLAVLLLSTALGFLFHTLGFTEANIITVYILGVLLIALFTRNYWCSGIASLASVLLFNFFFTEPRLSFYAYESGYPVTFVIMLTASLITGTLANRLTDQARRSAEVALRAENEQLRANLLRSISHDLRTPLTSISGNAENLLANDDRLAGAERRAVLQDICDDSVWLIRLVENLLAITKIEEGRTQIKLSAELVEDVIAESLRHVRHRDTGHTICMDLPEALLLAQMDARLISQVIVNLVENAVKHTPAGCEIRISAGKRDSQIWVSVADNGPGIPDGMKAQVFDMFFTGDSQVADCRRSMGLGLALCKIIIAIHAGQIKLTDNTPTGCIFTFTLPASEVNING